MASLLAIVHSVQTGELTVKAATALIVSSFDLNEDQVNAIFEANNIDQIK